ncbi:MAG TPA: hypothetical protein PK811_08235, partial [bacterium]|nr:hypothetical protein [bacterium]
MDYIPHLPEDIRHMLEALGLDSVDQLFSDIPDNLKLNKEI